MARPTLLNDANAAQVVACIRVGLPLKYAAEYAGLSHESALRYLRIGRAIAEGTDADTDSWTVSLTMRKRCEKFAADVRKAEAESALTHTANVARAGKSDWRASLALLERRFPQEYSPKMEVRVRSIESLEAELVSLVGPQKAAELCADARRRIRAAFDRGELTTGELPTAEGA